MFWYCVALHTYKKKQRQISDRQVNYDRALCDTIMSGSHLILAKQLQLRWYRNRELPLYITIFCSHDKIGSMEEEKDLEYTSISHTGTFFLFLVRGMQFIASSAEKQLLFDISICILAFLQLVIWINTFILEIFEQIVLYTGNLSFQNMKTFQPPILIQNIFLGYFCERTLNFQFEVRDRPRVHKTMIAFGENSIELKHRLNGRLA